MSCLGDSFICNMIHLKDDHLNPAKHYMNLTTEESVNWPSQLKIHVLIDMFIFLFYKSYHDQDFHSGNCSLFPVWNQKSVLTHCHSISWYSDLFHDVALKGEFQFLLQSGHTVLIPRGYTGRGTKQTSDWTTVTEKGKVCNLCCSSSCYNNCSLFLHNVFIIKTKIDLSIFTLVREQVRSTNWFLESLNYFEPIKRAIKLSMQVKL